MRIGINALGLSPGQVGGVEVYLRNLVVNLGRIAPDNEYLVFVDRHNQSVFGPGLPSNVRPVVIAPPPPASPVTRALRYWGWLPSPLARLQADSVLYLDLKQRALARSALFSWEKTARGVLGVYKMLCNRLWYGKQIIIPSSAPIVYDYELSGQNKSQRRK